MFKKKMLTKLLLTVVLAVFLGFGVGFGVVSANSYFSSHINNLKEEYDNKIDEFMQDPSPVYGAMHSYLNHELHPKLDEEAEKYYQEALSKWQNNQATLSDEEKQELDNAYNEALEQVKANIDAKFAEYGGY